MVFPEVIVSFILSQGFRYIAVNRIKNITLNSYKVLHRLTYEEKVLTLNSNIDYKSLDEEIYNITTYDKLKFKSYIEKIPNSYLLKEMYEDNIEYYSLKIFYKHIISKDINILKRYILYRSLYMWLIISVLIILILDLD